MEDATIMNQKQDNQFSNNNIGGDVNFSPIQNYYNGPEDPLSNKSDKEKAIHYSNLGHDKIGDDDSQAADNFRRSINYDDSLPSPHMGLGTIAYRKKNLKTALLHYKKAESLYEKFPTLAGQRQEVIKLIQKILDQQKPWFMRIF